MGKYIGIDLGTTFSVAAVIDDEGKPVVIKDFMSNRELIPSTVYFTDNKSVTIGADANCTNNQERFVEHVKFKMGTDDEVCNIDNTGYRAEEISAMILKRIKEYTSQQLGDILVRLLLFLRILLIMPNKLQRMQLNWRGLMF